MSHREAYLHVEGSHGKMGHYMIDVLIITQFACKYVIVIIQIRERGARRVDICHFYVQETYMRRGVFQSLCIIMPAHPIQLHRHVRQANVHREHHKCMHYLMHGSFSTVSLLLEFSVLGTSTDILSGLVSTCDCAQSLRLIS